MGAEPFYLAADQFPETCRPILKKLPTICRISLYPLRETPIPTTQHSYLENIEPIAISIGILAHLQIGSLLTNTETVN